MINDSKHDLKDHMEMLRELDIQRKKSADLRDKGIEVLMGQKKTLTGLPPQSSMRPLAIWALSVRAAQPFEEQDREKKRMDLMKELADQLDDLTLKDIASSGASVFFAAEILRALTMVPGYGFSKAAILCYLWIIRELYTAERSDWSTGGLRADNKGYVTAFITGKCVYAVQSFANAQRRTGDFIAAAGGFQRKMEQLRTIGGKYFPTAPNILNPWTNVERQRLEMSVLINLRQLHRNVVLRIESPDGGIYDMTQQDNKSNFEEYIDEKIIRCLGQKLEKAKENFTKAKEEITKYHPDDESNKLDYASRARIDCGHTQACSAVEDAITRLEKGLESYEHNAWDSIKDGFNDAAKAVENLFHPTSNFLSSVLDRELAAVSMGQDADSRPAELAFAAASYGRLTGAWEDDARLVRAAKHLTKMISFHGLFPNQRPFHQLRTGGHVNHGNAVVIYTFCQLLKHVKDERDLPIGSPFIAKLLTFFEETRADDYRRRPFQFRDKEIKLCLADKFRKPENYITTFLKEQFDNELRTQLDKSRNEDTFDDLKKDLEEKIIPKLTKELNRLLETDLIGEDKCLAGMQPQDESAQALLEKKPQGGEERILLQRMLLEELFPNEIEKIKAPPYTESSEPGWCAEYASHPRETDLWATASAVLALAKVNEMLDERMNHQIMEHFSVRRIDAEHGGKLSLEKLLYPDFGLCQARDEKKSESSESTNEQYGQKRHKLEETIAATLQKMRAHVTRVALPKEELGAPIYSLILHGPAGTGKTTLVEALATSCGVPMIEVTPSDLVMLGEQHVEQRARTVFEALSLLTRVVILFDEFDPVLKRRDPDDKTARSIFSFLTPGMLPKLKNLYRSAKGRGVAYVLITNLIGTLDEAAIRSGRFDKKVGIYPPDLVSRVGRFLSELEAFLPEEKQTGLDEKKTNTLATAVRAVVINLGGDSLFWKRLLHILKKTGGKGMTTLGSPGWFTRPDKNRPQPAGREDVASGYESNEIIPFDYLVSENGADEIKHLESEDELPRKPRGKGAAAETEYLQWQWVYELDKELGGGPIGSDHAQARDVIIDALKKAADKPIKPSPQQPDWRKLSNFQKEIGT